MANKWCQNLKIVKGGVTCDMKFLTTSLHKNTEWLTKKCSPHEYKQMDQIHHISILNILYLNLFYILHTSLVFQMID